jgi:ABC-type nitrate/sulfonate/bicarbonate transport system substrate-binding protein
MKIALVANACRAVIPFLALGFLFSPGMAADKLVGIHSARTMSQSMPWMADEAGLFKKYDIDFQLVFISSAAMVTAAMLSGDGEVAITGAESITRAFTQGVTKLIFIASAKNTLTHSILGKAEIKRPEDLKGKKLGLTRLGRLALFCDSGVEKIRHGTDRGKFYPDQRPKRESCGIVQRSRGRRHDDWTLRRS